MKIKVSKQAADALRGLHENTNYKKLEILAHDVRKAFSEMTAYKEKISQEIIAENKEWVKQKTGIEINEFIFSDEIVRKYANLTFGEYFSRPKDEIIADFIYVGKQRAERNEKLLLNLKSSNKSPYTNLQQAIARWYQVQAGTALPYTAAEKGMAGGKNREMAFNSCNIVSKAVYKPIKIKDLRKAIELLIDDVPAKNLAEKALEELLRKS